MVACSSSKLVWNQCEHASSYTSTYIPISIAITQQNTPNSLGQTRRVLFPFHCLFQVSQSDGRSFLPNNSLTNTTFSSSSSSHLGSIVHETVLQMRDQALICHYQTNCHRAKGLDAMRHKKSGPTWMLTLYAPRKKSAASISS
jgi:hypothetical protein